VREEVEPVVSENTEAEVWNKDFEVLTWKLSDWEEPDEKSEELSLLGFVVGVGSVGGESVAPSFVFLVGVFIGDVWHDGSHSSALSEHVPVVGCVCLVFWFVFGGVVYGY